MAPGIGAKAKEEALRTPAACKRKEGLCASSSLSSSFPVRRPSSLSSPPPRKQRRKGREGEKSDVGMRGSLADGGETLI